VNNGVSAIKDLVEVQRAQISEMVASQPIVANTNSINANNIDVVVGAQPSRDPSPNRPRNSGDNYSHARIPQGRSIQNDQPMTDSQVSSLRSL